MKLKKIMLLSLFCGVATGAALAQEVRIRKQIVGSPSGEISLPSFDVITTNGAIDAKQVKGAPVAAEFSSESIQTLADGNRIIKRSTTNFYRDAEGRTRREQSFGGIGNLTAGSQNFGRQIFLYDPVTNSNFVLNPLFRTANRSKIFTVNVDPNAKAAPGNAQVKVFKSGSAPGFNDPALKARVEAMLKENEKNFAARQTPETREESLGSVNIEGTEADGKRITTVLPAGFIGNEKPIEIVRETWFSKELQMIVMTTTKNPLSGEQTYKLTSLSRADQPRTLFEVPSDYKIVDGTNFFNHLTPGSPANGEPLHFQFPGAFDNEKPMLLFKQSLSPERSSK